MKIFSVYIEPKLFLSRLWIMVIIYRVQHKSNFSFLFHFFLNVVKICDTDYTSSAC